MRVSNYTTRNWNRYAKRRCERWVVRYAEAGDAAITEAPYRTEGGARKHYEHLLGKGRRGVMRFDVAPVLVLVPVAIVNVL